MTYALIHLTKTCFVMPMSWRRVMSWRSFVMPMSWRRVTYSHDIRITQLTKTMHCIRHVHDASDTDLLSHLLGSFEDAQKSASHVISHELGGADNVFSASKTLDSSQVTVKSHMLRRCLVHAFRIFDVILAHCMHMRVIQYD